MLNRLVRVQATASALSPERFDGAILFWEEAFTSTSTVWNDLHVLRQAGVLDRISGMVVGRPFEVEATPPGPDSLRDIVLEVVGERDIPVLGDVDIGHAGPNLPMPLGVRAEMDADAKTLSLLEPVVTLSGRVADRRSCYPGASVRGRRDWNSSQVSSAWITPRTYRHPPIERRGNRNLHSRQLNFGLSARR